MDELVEIGTYPEGEADIVAALLEANGIEAAIRPNLGAFAPAGGATVLVAPGDEEAARAAIAAEQAAASSGDAAEQAGATAAEWTEETESEEDE